MQSVTLRRGCFLDVPRGLFGEHQGGNHAACLFIEKLEFIYRKTAGLSDVKREKSISKDASIKTSLVS